MIAEAAFVVDSERDREVWGEGRALNLVEDVALGIGLSFELRPDTFVAAAAEQAADIPPRRVAEEDESGRGEAVDYFAFAASERAGGDVSLGGKPSPCRYSTLDELVVVEALAMNSIKSQPFREIWVPASRSACSPFEKRHEEVILRRNAEQLQLFSSKWTAFARDVSPPEVEVFRLLLADRHNRLDVRARSR
jgi:hypothetical protein